MNMLGLPAFVLLDFGDVQEVVELDPAECQTVLQPLPQPPQRHSVMCKPMAPERVLMVGILEALVKRPGRDNDRGALRELYCCIRCVQCCAYVLQEICNQTYGVHHWAGPA